MFRAAPLVGFIDPNPTAALVAATLDQLVPPEIERLRARGGPTQAEYEFARLFGWTLAHRGDRVIHYGTSRHEEATMIREGLVRSTAALAFLPGGITIFGITFEAVIRTGAEP